MKQKMRILALVLLLCTEIIMPLCDVKSDAGTRKKYVVKARYSSYTLSVGTAESDLDMFTFYKDGKRVNLDGEKVSYTVSNKKVFHMEKSNNKSSFPGYTWFRAKKTGTAVIRCKFHGQTAKVKLIAKKMSHSFSMEEGISHVYMPMGTEESLGVKFGVNDFKNNGAVKYKLSTSKYISISDKTITPRRSFGRLYSYRDVTVKAKKPGTTTVTIKSRLGKSKLKITVFSPPKGIRVSDSKDWEKDGEYYCSCKVKNCSGKAIKVGWMTADVLGEERISSYTGMIYGGVKTIPDGAEVTISMRLPFQFANTCIFGPLAIQYGKYSCEAYVDYPDDNFNQGNLCFSGMAQKCDIRDFYPNFHVK